MAGYLVGEEGPLSGQVFSFDEGDEWVLGRDPDAATVVLEDPMVSRKHAICRISAEGFFLENLSSVNPVTQNGKVVEDVVLLKEGDIVQIGSTFFRFTEINPTPEKKEELPYYSLEDTSDLSSFRIDTPSEMRFMLKVISGPNSGAEFGMQASSTYIIGKDPAICDIVFQDLSVSRQHARLILDGEDHVFIEDLGSKNGVIVNGVLTAGKKELTSQDLIALGTTSFLVIDRFEARETLISPPQLLPEEKKEDSILEERRIEEEKDWKEMKIPKKHLALAGILGIVVIGVFSMLLGLFNSTPITVNEKNETQQIQETIRSYPDIQFSFNPAGGKLFITGHVLTPLEKQELFYLLNNLPYVQSIDDNVVVDEYVWQNMNALLVTNPDWQAISVYSPTPGKFVLRGYLHTQDMAGALADYINLNFPYLDKLENQVVVENNLTAQIQSMLIEKGFSGINFQLSNGDLVFVGAVDATHNNDLVELLNNVKMLRGVRSIKNYVILSTQESARVDLSSKYQVSGSSKKDGTQNSVVINGKILSVGESLDGMAITGIQSNVVLLEKDGLKFKINYNLQ